MAKNPDKPSRVKTTKKTLTLPVDWLIAADAIIKKTPGTFDARSQVCYVAIRDFLAANSPRAVASKLSPVPSRGRPETV